jgi:uncharacterized protein YkwD
MYSVTACDFPEATLLPAGCAYETCVIPAWVVNGQNIPECTVTYTYYPEPSYYPEPYPWTSTYYDNGTPVISIINNISINIVTPTGSVYVPGGGSVAPTGTTEPTGPGGVEPTSNAFLLAASDGSIGVIADNVIEFVAADSTAATSFAGFLLNGGDLTDTNGNVGKIDDTALLAGSSEISFQTALARMLFRRADNTTATANGTLSFDFTSTGVFEAFYNSERLYFSICPPAYALKVSLSMDAGNCTSVTIVKKALGSTSTSTSATGTTTTPNTATGSTTSPTTTPTTSPTGTATGTTTTPTTSPTTTGSVPTDFADAMVYWHNQYRALHGVPNVTWNQTLADYAANYATECSTSHSGSPNYGENLAYGGYTNPSYYIYLWYDEIKNYDFSNPGFSKTTGHFTQVVWKDSIQIGCGWVTSCAGTLGSDYPNYLACEYYPYGNVDGEYASEVPAPISNATPPVPGTLSFHEYN